MYIYFFETLLYLSFAFTGGYILLMFIPDRSKPVVRNLPNLFQYAILSIPFFSFISILRTTSILSEFAGNLSFLEVLIVVLQDYAYGNAWISTLLICTVMFVATQTGLIGKTNTKFALAFLWLLSVIANGWASHPAGFSKLLGVLSQSIHVAAVSIWLGTLIIVAWFTKGEWNWKAFVRWFTPLSIICIVLIIVAGLIMMSLIVDGYINSWGINYGEALLLKHLVFIPLVLIGFMNGFLTKLTDHGRNEQRLQWWLRAETVIALIVLIITAYMGIQEPPHEGEVEQPQPSILFRLLHGDVFVSPLQWDWSVLPLVLITLGLVGLCMLIPLYKKDNRALFVFGVIVAILFPFLGLLLSVK